MGGNLRLEPRRVELSAAERLQAVDDRLLHGIEAGGQGDAEGRGDLRDLLQGRRVIGHEHRPERLDRVGLGALLSELAGDDLEAVARRGLGQGDSGGEGGGPVVAVVAMVAVVAVVAVVVGGHAVSCAIGSGDGPCGQCREAGRDDEYGELSGWGTHVVLLLAVIEAAPPTIVEASRLYPRGRRGHVGQRWLARTRVRARTRGSAPEAQG